MTRDEAVAALLELATSNDPEAAHLRADEILLDVVGDDAIRRAFEAVPRWYS